MSEDLAGRELFDELEVDGDKAPGEVGGDPVEDAESGFGSQFVGHIGSGESGGELLDDQIVAMDDFVIGGVAEEFADVAGLFTADLLDAGG